MKAAVAAPPALRHSPSARTNEAHYWRVIGLTIAVGVPVVFWTSLIALLGYAFGVAVSPIALALVAGASGFVCVFVAAALMGEGEGASRKG